LRLLLATDAWAPQVNGVVVTLRNTVACLERMGHEVRVVSPEGRLRTSSVVRRTFPSGPIVTVVTRLTI